MSAHQLRFGELDLCGGWNAEEGFTLNVLPDGASFGAADAVTSAILSLMADGDLVQYDRAGNREVSLRVEVSAAGGEALARGEAALSRETRKANTLTWTPPDGFGAPTVFNVVTSWMDFTFDDAAELRGQRVYTLTLVCEPHARSEALIVAKPLSTSGAPTSSLINSCDAATGWTATRNGAPDLATTFWEAGAVGVVYLGTDPLPPQVWTLSAPDVVSFTSRPYLVVEARTVSVTDMMRAFATVGGVRRELGLLSMRALTGDYNEYVFLGDGSGATLTFEHTSGAGEVWQGLLVRNISQRSHPPGATARQVSRIIPIEGTERTPGSLRVSQVSGTGRLGPTLVHTSPEAGSGYSPPLRRWRVMGNTETTDAATFSGKREPIGPTSFAANVPTASLPSGTYNLVAMMRCSSAAARTVLVSTSTLFPGDDSTQHGFTLTTAIAPHSGPNVWEWFSLAVLTLPSVRTVGGKVQIAIQGDADVELDEAWLFRVDDGCALTMIDADEPNLWLDSPSVSGGSPSIWVGKNANRSDAHHPGGSSLRAQGTHIFQPDRMAVFVATQQAEYPDVEIAYYPRWHTHAAK